MPLSSPLIFHGALQQSLGALAVSLRKAFNNHHHRENEHLCSIQSFSKDLGEEHEFYIEITSKEYSGVNCILDFKYVYTNNVSPDAYPSSLPDTMHNFSVIALGYYRVRNVKGVTVCPARMANGS